MKYRERLEVLSFFDVSIVMPFFNRLGDFTRTLPYNAKFFQRNGIEVVVVLDSPHEELGLIKLIEQYPFINFKIIVNRTAHEWRNPCKVLNVGVKNSSYNFIMVLDPEVELITDVIYQLRYVITFYQNSYVTGVVAFLSHDEDISNVEAETIWLPYGSIMMAKRHLLVVRGYNENFTKWGGEDNQIRRKLDLIGLQHIELLDAKTVHREKNSDGHMQRSLRVDEMPIKHLKNILYPKKAVFNDETWGLDFDEIIWSWDINKSYDELYKYLSLFEKYWTGRESTLKSNFQIVCLVQTRNEANSISEFLLHLDSIFDGVIVLDDGSTDTTYEKTVSEKLLLKVKKKYKGYFDDLQNRNLLLRLSSFFKSQWFVFIDVDERFDERYNNVRKLTMNDDIDVYSFLLVDIWNNKDTYRYDLPYGENGVLKRGRMFRSHGSLQIISQREIHFPAVPYYRNHQIADILIHHHGNFSKQIRRKKYELYSAQDRDGKKMGLSSYDYLLENEVHLKPVADLNIQNYMKSIRSKQLNPDS